MYDGGCLPIEPLRAALAALEAADGAEIVAEAERFRSTAGALCGSVRMLLDVAASDEKAGALFFPDACSLPVEKLRRSRDALVTNLRCGCLYCGGDSPFGA